MLSRVANTLYWMARNVERADNLARLIDVNQQLLLDFESLDSERLRGFWKPIIQSLGEEESFDSHYDDAGSSQVIRFLTDDERNPNSIASCIAQARENARTIRDQLSDELWEELNSLYLFTRSADASFLIESNPPKYYESIRRAAMTFLGVAASTMSRNEAWEFMDLGRQLERADKTTRFLDITSYLPKTEDDEVASPGVLHWTAILRSCGAMGAFRSEHQEISARSVVDFLMFSPEFPRSIRFCVDRIDASLHKISGTARGAFSNEAEREAGKLLSVVNYSTTDDVFDDGLHCYLDGLQAKFNSIGSEMFETYVLLPERTVETPPEPAARVNPAVAAWQLEQQQQQQKKND